MIRRGLLIGGLGLSLTAAGIASLPVLAQDSASEVSTSETSTSSTTDGSLQTETTREARRAEFEAERQALADDFLAKFTANLGLSDPAQVETALKDTLKEMIDEKFAAGEISANRADEMKLHIDEAESIFDLGLGGPGGFGGPGMGGPGMDGRRGETGRGPRGGDDAPVDANAPAGAEAPGNLPAPADEDASATPEA